MTKLCPDCGTSLDEYQDDTTLSVWLICKNTECPSNKGNLDGGYSVQYCVDSTGCDDAQDA